MKKKYVSRLLAGCLTVTMLTPTGALASVPQPVVTQEASRRPDRRTTESKKEQAEEYAAKAEVQTDETEAAENKTAAVEQRTEPQNRTADTVQPRAAVNSGGFTRRLYHQ